MSTIDFKLHDSLIKLSWENNINFERIYKLQTGIQHWKNISSDQEFLGRVVSLINWNFQRTILTNGIDINTINRIIDVGSGVGLFDLTLSQCNANTEFYLVDKSIVNIEKNIKYYSRENNHGFYNSWPVIFDIIKNSNLNIKKFKFLSPDNQWPKDVDLIVSLNSWCWHYPKEVYWNKMIDSLKIGGYLILDVLDLNDRNMVSEISEEMSSNPTVTLRTVANPLSHPFLNELTISDDNSFGGCYCWQRKK